MTWATVMLLFSIGAMAFNTFWFILRYWKLRKRIMLVELFRRRLSIEYPMLFNQLPGYYDMIFDDKPLEVGSYIDNSPN